MQLPIKEAKNRIIDAIIDNPVVIVVGETGSGKTTQLPQFLHEIGLAQNGMIGITQPRRIAATSVARFVASQMGTQLGNKVGYQVRFDKAADITTDIKFMTDGILLREFQEDADLSKYSVILVDEAHERSQNIDFLLGLLKDLLTRRPDLRIVISSATINAKEFSQYFNNAPVINVSGRTYPVEIVYEESELQTGSLVDRVVDKVIDIHLFEQEGDILVFMTGADDINQVIKKLDEKKLSGLVVLPAYAALDQEDQNEIFVQYPGTRKVVVATNIAETSITIDGICYVVDSGYIKQMNFDPLSGIHSLDMVEHSKAGCEQRAGRAGRTREGTCYRMFSKESFNERLDFTEPEIKRTSLASIVLAMEDIGINNIIDFDFVDPPDKVAFTSAYNELKALGAIRK